MLNYNRKNLYCISFILALVVCIIIFTIIDISTYSKINDYENITSKRMYIIDKNNIKKQSAKIMFMNLKSTYLELMQIGDIYENNSNITNIDNSKELSTNEEINESSKDKTKWRIIIPKINVDAPIKSGTTQDVLATAVGHFEESGYWNGNVALAGHNRGYNCNFFEKIKYLKIGDEITYSTENGIRKYKVILNEIIKQTDWSYIENTNDNRITLITCVENMYEYRRCVQAVEI